MSIESAGRVNVGGRDHQEDGAVNLNLGSRALLAAIDGMGGHIGGRESMGIAMKRLTNLAGKKPNAQILESELRMADREISAYADSMNLRRNRPGCVVTAIWINELADSKRLYVAHIGDTRAWISFQSGDWSMLTEDHTPLWRPLAVDRLSESQRMRSGGNNVISRHLGDGDEINTFEQVYPGTFGLLLCSDGLHDSVHPEIIKMIMNGLWDERTYEQTTLEVKRIRDLHLELCINSDELLLRVTEIILRNRPGGRSCKQVVDDLMEACLLYQPHMKYDNICVVVARITK